jgi:predicted nucleic acid-binding protein
MKQIFIDTNIILRLLLSDIPKQAEKARSIFKSIENKKSKGVISILVINKLIWILENYYEKNG